MFTAALMLEISNLTKQCYVTDVTCKICIKNNNLLTL
jgi:hypothetical protein